MNRKMETLLKEYFRAPEPEGKRRFLNSLPAEPMDLTDFLLFQAGYMPKWIWCLSVLMFALSLLGAGYFEKDMLWCISACMPLPALALVTVSGRSQTWGMAELEMSARFSLKSVLLARLGIVGIADLLLFFLLLPLAYMNGDRSLLETGIYMLCPYLLTVFLGLWASRKVHGREGAYLCAAAALGVGLGNAMMYQCIQDLYAAGSFRWWAAAFVLLSLGATRQCAETVKQKGETLWNLG